MMKFKTLAVLVLLVTVGCAQRQLPPPYPEDDQISDRPAAPTTSADPAYPDEASSPIKQGPRPLESPDISTAESSLRFQDPKSSPMSAGFVNDRIRVYQEKLELWKEVDRQAAIANLDEEQTQLMVKCFRDLQRVMSGYQTLHDMIFPEDGGAVNFSMENLVGLQRQDIAFLESRCSPLLDGADEAEGGLFRTSEQNALARLETQMEALYKSGAYGELVQFWSSIPPYQKEGVSKEAALAHANALIYLDQPAEAAAGYERVLNSMTDTKEPADDVLTLRRRLADLYAASGNFFAAESQYDQLLKDYEQIGKAGEWATLQLSMLERSMKGSPELTDYSELLRGYLRYIPEQDGYSVVYKAEEFLQQYPYSPVSANVDLIKAETMTLADGWFADKLEAADRLLEGKQFEEAIVLLQSLPQDKLSPENLLALKEKIDNLVLAEAVERETTKIEKMQSLQSTWNEGAAYAEAGDYDIAIEVFTQLLGTEYDTRAEERIEELSLTAAKYQRRRAADLFVRSNKTDDPQSRKQLLVESRQVLKDILKKYPDVEVADKVRGNIRTVEKKMNEIDPMLLPELEQQERDQLKRQEAELEMQSEIDGFDIDANGFQPSSPVP